MAAKVRKYQKELLESLVASSKGIKAALTFQKLRNQLSKSCELLESSILFSKKNHLPTYQKLPKNTLQGLRNT